MTRWALALSSILVGCYQPPPPVVLKAPFNPASVQWAMREGDNRIEGSALLRTRGGDVRTCAALDAVLVPVTVHAKERMIHLFGNVHGGFNPSWPFGRHPTFANEHPAYFETIRATKCDALGRFAFDDLPDGEFYVAAWVVWEAPGVRALQGGELMRRVRLAGGETVSVVLTH